MLDRGRIQVFADSFQNVLARVAVIAHDPYLDEFVGRQAAAYFAGDRRCKAAAADQHDGFEGMGTGFERSAFDGREWQRHGNLLKQVF
jgi:hypothetical protein